MWRKVKYYVHVDGIEMLNEKQCVKFRKLGCKK